MENIHTAWWKYVGNKREGKQLGRTHKDCAWKKMLVVYIQDARKLAA